MSQWQSLNWRPITKVHLLPHVPDVTWYSHKVLETGSGSWGVIQCKGYVNIESTLVPWETWLEEKQDLNFEGDGLEKVHLEQELTWLGKGQRLLSDPKGDRREKT